jgi:hypothetical protein
MWPQVDADVDNQYVAAIPFPRHGHGQLQVKNDLVKVDAATCR